MIIIIPIIVIAIGLVLVFIVRKKYQNKIMNMELTKTRTIGELTREFSGMEDGYRQIVELKEYASSKNLLQAPFSKQSVIYYESIVREITEQKIDKVDSNGNHSTSTETKKEVIFEDISSNKILLKDSQTEDTVSIGIEKGMDIPVTYCRSLNPMQARVFLENSGIKISSNIFSDLGMGGSRITGYELEERAIKQGQKLYILGEALKSENEILIVKPEDKTKPFIVSTKTEEELSKSIKLKSNLSLIGGIALIAFGISLFFKI